MSQHTPETPPSPEAVAERLSLAATTLISDVLEGIYLLDESQRGPSDFQILGGINQAGQTIPGDSHDYVIEDGLVSYQQEVAGVRDGHLEVNQVLFVPVTTDPKRRDNAGSNDRFAPGVTLEVVRQADTDDWQLLTLRQGTIVRDGLQADRPDRQTRTTEYLSVDRQGNAQYWTTTHCFDEAIQRMRAQETPRQQIAAADTLSIGGAMLKEARQFVHRRYFSESSDE